MSASTKDVLDEALSRDLKPGETRLVVEKMDGEGNRTLMVAYTCIPIYVRTEYRDNSYRWMADGPLDYLDRQPALLEEVKVEIEAMVRNTAEKPMMYFIDESKLEPVHCIVPDCKKVGHDHG